MIHGPCGSLSPNSPCMNEHRCAKKYPKAFQDNTSCGDDGYPKYRRLSPTEGGQTASLRNYSVDNSWVIPYNPVLLKAFIADINVELCSSIKSIKYVCKYINKGSDQATFTINSKDEIQEFQSGRYICTSEALWRIFSFDIHGRHPTITHLAVHLENGQRVYFNENNVNDIVNNPTDTTLTAFFKLCADDEFSKTITYDKVPAYYTWNGSAKKFQRKKIGTPVQGYENLKKSDALGRVYVVHPNNSECFYLRMLLHKVKGPTSFHFLRTVQGTTLSSYQAACKALGMLEDDSHWEQTLLEAVVSTSSISMRYLFAIILSFCQVSDAVELWNKFKESMSEDILQRKRREAGNRNLDYNQLIFDESLCELNKIVISLCGKTVADFSLALITDANTIHNTIYAREKSYDQHKLLEIVRQNEDKLNSEQKSIYNSVSSSVFNHEGKIFFLDAPGGTGKTFLINLLLAKIRSSGEIALAVASSGIAATLLDGGRTAHSMFKIPLNVTEEISSICNIPKQSSTAKLMQECSLIVWDEATMAHKSGVDALDKTLQDLRNKFSPMGGCTVLFSGDFRQILPVVSRGTRADEVKACLKRSQLWQHMYKVQLQKNMRLTSGLANELFAKALLKIGIGQMTDNNSNVDINESLCVPVKSLEGE
ncbi:PREDICTED: uncharacterized protein LOC108360582 isoform X2 [Rhagoletis zephyria]|uniref:uncharacterized protein LOC108360582 isoform X1 n=1 Tax=Rhagoletis zephyria TaxID=28612 RepID=UPI0008116431|nr:PREDICTED: uncharacterized protein LOC108360582 isoform X1 [Rhagoletis zephyria]XP_017468424.1 PREDICTED: uncharacterized protein LOC108360582 isoform X2 [Rhagoletis zephyria]